MNLFFQAKLKAAVAKARKARRVQKAMRLARGVKKITLSKAKKNFWADLSRAVRAEYGPGCFTCSGPGMQCGHMRPKGYSHTLSAWLVANLRPQCLTCNLHMGGNGAEYRDRYVAQYGQEAYDQVTILWRTPHKWTVPEILEMHAKLGQGLSVYVAFYDKAYVLPALYPLADDLQR